MIHIPETTVAEARSIDVLTYLEKYDPDELVPEGHGRYHSREHDSLKIDSNGWFWFSQNIGSKTALDYLIRVKDVKFADAVLLLTELPPEVSTDTKTIWTPQDRQEKEPKEFMLPRQSFTTDVAGKYLEGRGIDRDIVRWCIRTKRIYESYPHHNVVFVGFDHKGDAKYASQRGCGSDFVGEVSGSDKRFSFNVPAISESNTLYVFESAIDLLSFATLLKMEGYEWRSVNMLSLSGIYAPKIDLLGKYKLPRALSQYLADNPNIHSVVACFDNDDKGRGAAYAVKSVLTEEGYAVKIKPPREGKDYNDQLCLRKNLPITHRAPREEHKETAPAAQEQKRQTRDYTYSDTFRRARGSEADVR